MQDVRIGEVLCRMGVITNADVSRILADQQRTRQKFGQVSIRLGLATQEQVWEAWARQLAEQKHFDLAEIGSDTAALERVPLTMARQLGVVPLRLWGQHLVLAGPPDLPSEALHQLRRETGCRIHICASDPASIRGHLECLAGIHDRLEHPTSAICAA